MSSEKEDKKPTIPLTTVTSIVSSTVDSKVKVSKSFLRLVCVFEKCIMVVDARMW